MPSALDWQEGAWICGWGGSVTAEAAAGMFRQGSNSGNKRLASGAHLSQPNIPVSLSSESNKTQEMGRSSKTNPLNAMGLDNTITAPGGDPDYIMQLVNDVRKFSDVLLSLKEAFHSKGEILLNLCYFRCFQKCFGALQLWLVMWYCCLWQIIFF